ncbi:helix-turn-helix domain-containing protein [Streptomyces sp. NPDC091377]|uniref:helix-turn-helix domain-containing protein n=1 Tax=Streptomyces sp. NPDC091377 TaxID=3365995 RepID=UPI0038088048
MPRPRSGPGVLHAVLATRLKWRREGAGVSHAQAAAELGAHPATVRRIEGAETSLDAGQVGTLLRFYGAGEAEIAEVVAQLAEANAPGWWHPWRDVMDEWQQQMMSVETASSLIRVWDPALVPELLRTPAYAQAVDRLRSPGVPDRVRIRRAEFLAERQARITARKARIWALMPEAALHTRVGTPAVMAEQIEALRAAARPPRGLRTVQVSPLAGPAHPLTGAPALALYRVDVEEIPDHVVRDSPVGPPKIRDDTTTVTAYRMLLDQACAAAPGPENPLPTL